MRGTLTGILAFVALATFAVSAGANGSLYSPGLTYGWDGVRAPADADERFVTLADDRRTIAGRWSPRSA